MSTIDIFQKHLVVMRIRKNGSVVIMTFEGPARMKLDDLIDQPAEGLLYDLNRDMGTVLTFIEDPKWVNDFVVYKVITELKKRLDAVKDL